MVWKMFATIFTFALVLAYVAAEIPSYIHVCGRQNPNLDQCITNSINDMKDNICKGIPELQSPPIEPFFVDKIAISDVDNAKLYLRDATITGLCDFTINSLHIDLDKLHFDIGVIFKKVFLNGTYDFDVHVLVPFVQKGPVFLTTENLLASVGVDMKIVNKNNKRYVYMSKLNLILDIKTLSSKFDMNGEEKSQLNEILSTFLGSNEEEFINRVKPTLGKEISKQVLSIGNNIVKHFTFDELFPERP
ncbi:uncharacterized protein LOC112458370 [Temnothorax curvispinosus]|uniref:Uncharacterized protein LOC112458370 n=1 Tax=Temnothorax curvispinosus TaxID=300111 RepID=A0A6J1Q8R1_9HYME|nr:uncharacterized protein LOC112458370 [Temnothorax curvispinosus]